MSSFEEEPKVEFVKCLVLGDPGSGKTGSITSLVQAGYKLRIYDFDNLLGSLKSFVNHTCPDLRGNISSQTFTDKMKGLDMPLTMQGNALKVMPFLDGTPTAFSRALKQLNYWKDGEEDLGKPSEWGADTFVVIDSLTNMAQAAFRYVQGMNPMAKEPQSWYFAAQQLVMNVIQLLYSEQFATNVLVLAHVQYDQNQFNITKGFPRSIGSALGGQIGAYFNSILLLETVGTRRQIRTTPTGIVDLKNPVPFKVPDTLPIETGLADFVSAIKAA